MSSFSPRSNSLEHEMIETQREIDKLQADLEYHEQKIRLIKNELDHNQNTLSNLSIRVERFRAFRDRRNNSE
jgi:chromosome segregation ATPase